MVLVDFQLCIKSKEKTAKIQNSRYTIRIVTCICRCAVDGWMLLFSHLSLFCFFVFIVKIIRLRSVESDGDTRIENKLSLRTSDEWKKHLFRYAQASGHTIHSINVLGTIQMKNDDWMKHNALCFAMPAGNFNKKNIWSAKCSGGTLCDYELFSIFLANRNFYFNTFKLTIEKYSKLYLRLYGKQSMAKPFGHSILRWWWWWRWWSIVFCS